MLEGLKYMHTKSNDNIEPDREGAGKVVNGWGGSEGVDQRRYCNEGI